MSPPPSKAAAFPSPQVIHQEMTISVSLSILARTMSPRFLRDIKEVISSQQDHAQSARGSGHPRPQAVACRYSPELGAGQRTMSLRDCRARRRALFWTLSCRVWDAGKESETCLWFAT